MKVTGPVRSLAGSLSRDASRPEPVHPAAAFVCAIGILLRILLSGPVLNILGIDYGGEEGSPFGKIHPGGYFIYMSFLMLIFSRGNPLLSLVEIARRQTAFFAFFAIYLLLIAYWLLRGPKGIGVMFDVHIVAPMAAIVLSYAPRSYCRAIVYLVFAMTILNGMVGLGEAMTHKRIFSFDPDWEVLHQDYFRSSAFLGHPLANAAFSSLGLFIALSLRMPPLLKAVGFLILLSSLIAFGGRSALGFSLLGLLVLGIVELRGRLSKGPQNVLQMLAGAAIVLIVPLMCAGFLYVLLHSGMGERLMAYNTVGDDSAETRLMAFKVFDRMSLPDLIFGSDGEQTMALASQIGVKDPTSDIENPWILMLLFLGAIMFSVWFLGWAAYVRQLMIGSSAGVRIAVIVYYALASTSNSFGRQDPIYVIIGGLVVCMRRAFQDGYELAQTKPTRRARAS